MMDFRGGANPATHQTSLHGVSRAAIQRIEKRAT